MCLCLILIKFATDVFDIEYTIKIINLSPSLSLYKYHKMII